MKLAAAFLLGAVAPSFAQPSKPEPFSIVEASIAEMQAAMKDGRVTSRELVLLHLARIAQYEDRLNAVVAINARALEEAEALDRE
ncbi:MAG TPA: amidase, partial [Vicinamibacteria bacterium]|nr:amidase [Vicinamibacteria bacterium]